MKAQDKTSRLRVCILARANPFLWVPHYVNAFRQCCDVVTVGPSLTDEDLRALKYTHLAHLLVPNDIDIDYSEMQAFEVMDRLPAGWTPDLVVGIQSGPKRVQGIGQLACPTAYISVDTWHDTSEFLTARQYDAVFVAQREYVSLLEATGSSHVYWLPLACDPAVHHPVESQEEFDIAMAGACSRGLHLERARRLDALGRHFEMGLFEGLSKEDMCQAYGRGRLAFNSSISQDVNMRVFETLAMGRALLTNRDADLNGLFDLFEDKTHLIGYDDDDLEALAQEYLANDAVREAVAQAGRGEVLAKHTYEHRITQLLDTMRSLVPELGRESGGTVRDGAQPADYLPAIPGHVVDLGAACSPPPPSLAQYTSIAPEKVAEGLDGVDEVDTVVLSRLKAFALDIESAFALGWRLLREGGTVVFIGDSDELANTVLSRPGDTLETWLRHQDFHRLALHPVRFDSPPGNCVLLARKRTRTLVDVLTEIFKRHPAPELTLEDIPAAFPADY